MCFDLCSQFLRLLHFDRFQSIFLPDPLKKKLCKIAFYLRTFWRAQKEIIASIKWNFLHGLFFRGAFAENEHSGMLKKKTTRDKAFFCGTKKDFCFHVCFNPKLPAKQQQFHCFRAQCKMRGCQLTEVFLVSKLGRDFIKIFLVCLSVAFVTAQTLHRLRFALFCQDWRHRLIYLTAEQTDY